MSAQASVDALLQWCTSQGFEIDSRLQIRPDENGGIGVYTQDYTIIKSNAAVVKIPKRAVLSARNCALSELLEPLAVGLEAQMTLALALYSELLLDQKSKWFGYLQSLPQIVELPLIWQSSLLRVDSGKHDEQDRLEALEWLTATEVYRILNRKGGDGETLLESITSFYRLTGEPLLRGHIDVGFRDDISFLDFVRAYCLVSSRSFLVDRFHGLAMVPIADAFNHTQDNHVHIESDFEVCHECGSIEECPHDQAEGEPHDRKADIGAMPSGFFEMVTNVEVPPSTEVFNTYGETLSNAQLLTRYGFILDVNENDGVFWTLGEIFDDLGVDQNATVREGMTMTEAIVMRIDELLNDNPFVHSAQELEALAMHKEDDNAIAANIKNLPRMLFVDSDGKPSVVLWLTLVCIADYSAKEAFQMPTLDRCIIVKEMMKTLDILLGVLGDGLPVPPDGVLWPTDKRYLHLISTSGDTLLRLCEQRYRSIGKPGINDVKAGEVMDSLDDGEHERTRRALAIALSERAILMSCRETWNDYLGLLACTV